MPHTLFPGAMSKETAQVTKDYPYGGMRTEMYFWVEYRKGYGFRPVTMSINPKTGKENKPHTGNYNNVWVCVGYNADNGHFEFVHAPTSINQNGSNFQEFINDYWNQLPTEIKNRLDKFWTLTKLQSPEYYKDTVITFPEE